MRAVNSALRSPANTRCEWESTNPGITAWPPSCVRSSAAGAWAAGPNHAIAPASTTTAASASTPSREPSPVAGSLVTSWPISVINLLTAGPTAA